MLTAHHAIITDRGRKKRGDIEAFMEASNRCFSEYLKMVEAHKIGDGFIFHLKLKIELPQEIKVRCE